MKGVDLRRVFIVVIIAYLSFLLGCTGMVAAPKHGIWFYHKELPEADRAVEAARSAGKDKECPEAFKAVEDLKNKAYETYWSCRVKDAIEIAKDATNRAKALCAEAPSAVCPGAPTAVTGEPGTPTPVTKEPGAPSPMVKETVCPMGVEKLTLTVNFDFDKSNIRKVDIVKLQEAINFIKKHPGAKVRLEGHTDSMGTDEYNQKLSERRAESVKKYLTKEGAVNKKMISTIGYGKTRPIASNDTEEGRAKNRRVEIVILAE